MTKNQQFKIAVVAVLVICLISSIIAAVRSSTSSPSESTPGPGPASKTEDEAAVKELQKAVEDLETIKDRIKNAEEGYRENYRSETNNGLTVIGTLMEQMVDVMIAVLKQPLVAEAVSKRIVNKQDADEIAEYIEMLGQEVVKEVEQTQLLRCGRPMVEKCQMTKGEEKASRIKYGQPMEQCWYEEGEGDVPEDNCEVYKFNQDKVEEGTKRAAANLYNKVLSVVEKAEERDKMYRITKNIVIDNKKQITISNGGTFPKNYTFPEQSKLENIAMAHYKYLGHDLKRELGESINISELTGEEENKVKYLIDRNKDRVSKRLVKVAFDIYEEPDYKGNNQQFGAVIPEGEAIKLGNSKSNPIKSLKLGKNIVLEGARVDSNEPVRVEGPTEDNNTGSGYYNVVIFVRPPIEPPTDLGPPEAEGYRI
jgi:hypothetical protein